MAQMENDRYITVMHTVDNKHFATLMEADSEGEYVGKPIGPKRLTIEVALEDAEAESVKRGLEIR